MSAYELVIRLGRPFDIRIGDRYLDSVREITIPFDGAHAAVAEAAAREVEVSVRPVHDAGGEDYRAVVPGQVVSEPLVIELQRRDPAEAAELMRADLIERFGWAEDEADQFTTHLKQLCDHEESGD